MNEVRRSHDAGKLVLGLTIVAFGVIFLLGNLHMIESESYLRYWPVILIAFGLAKLLAPRDSGGRMFGLIIGGVGVLLLLREFGKISWSVWDFWPVLLVLLGLSIIWGAFGRRSHWSGRCGRSRVSYTIDGGHGTRQIDPDSTLDVNAIFGGSDRVVTSQDFRGGSISTIMGGCDIDFREASIAGGEAVLDVSVVFGGVEMRVPEDWKVVVRLNAILGGVDDKTRKPAGDGNKTLILSGNVIFGGLEVRN